MSKLDWLELAFIALAIPVGMGVWLGGTLLMRHLIVLAWGCTP